MGDRRTTDIACVAAYLAMAERQNAILNGIRAGDALEAFGRLVEIKPFLLRTLARDPAVETIISTALRDST
jgi:hypothetical protein